MTDIQRRLNNMRGGTASITDRLNTMRNSGESFKETEKAETKENPLFTPAEDGFFEGLAILPSSPQQALKDIGYTTERLGAGLLGALEGVTDIMNVGLGKAVQGVTSLGGLLPNPVSEWGKEWAENALNTSPTQQWEESIRERYNPSKGAENLSGVGQTIAQMLPAIGVGSAISAGGSALNAAQAASKGANVGRAIMGAQAAGNVASEAAAEGADTNQALAYGLTSGLLETTIESIAGGIPGLGRGKIGEIADAVKANPIISRVLDIAGEGGEEALSTVLSPYLKRAIYDPDAESATAEEIAQSAILGAVAAGVLQAGLELPTAVSDTMSDIRRVRQEVGSNQDIINRANQRIAQDLQARREAANPLLPRFQTAGDGQTDSQIGQRDNRLYLPGSDQGQEAVRNNNTAPIMGAGDAAASVPSAGETNAVSQLRPNGSEADGSNQIVSTVRDKVNQIVLDNLNKGKGYADILAISDEIVSLMPDDLSSAGTVFSDLLNSGRYGVTATGEMYQVDPARHIDDREIQEVGDRGLKAFQFENPQLHDYFVEAARALKYDLFETIPGERFYLPGNMYDDRPMQGTWSGVKRKTSEGIAQLKDNWHMSYKDIEKAADAIINDSGQENYAAAKRVEIILDDMLTNGYRSPMGEWNPPNEAYIQAKSKLPGAYIPDSSVENDPLPLDIPYRPEQETSPVRPDSSVGAARYGFDPYTNLQGKYGTLPEGEKPSRVVDVPARTSDKSKVSLTARTVMEAAVTPDSSLPDVAQLVVDGRLSYIPVSNNQRTVMAESKIKRVGYSDALANWRSDVRAGKSSADLVAMGAQLYNATVNAGDTKAAMDILYDYTRLIRSGAQATQAARILKTLTPAGTLYMIQKEVNNINEAQPSKKKKTVSSSDNVPVEIWMQRVGENLADELSRRIEAPKDQVQTVAQTILSDLRRYANETAPKRLQTGKTRTEMNRIMDLFQNKAAYNEAWAAAKDTLSDTFENDPDALAAFDDWLNQSLDYTKALTKELTKQSDIVISEDLADAYLNAETEDARAQALDAIYQSIADQVPSTWRDKWNAWRYLAMLANPRTHVRNFVGNIGFQPLRFAKDRVASVIEAGVSRAGGKIERTKSFAVSPELYRAAWNDWPNVKDVLSGNKYDDVRSEINSRRRIFKTAPLEAARTGNSWLLEVEDSIFKRITYSDALAGYLQANGVTAEQVRNNTVDSNLMARARDYAGQEALKATYQDRNQFSDLMSRRARETGAVSKAANVALDAVLPFRRTPANILVRGFEYSPLGLTKSLTADLYKVKQGKMSAAEAIDHIAAGLTGTGLFALGAYLFSEGIVTSGGGDDENQDALNELTGGQNYALNLPGGGNVTLDWLAPEALPFFMGVELMDSLGQDGSTAESIMSALSSISEPMLNLSMLQSLNDMIDSVSYADSSQKITGLVGSALISYFTQAIPTIGGQFERSVEENRMSTYTDKNLQLPTDIQYAIGRASARIPGWDYQQIPYIDAWGRREDSGPLWLRTANNFLNPAYTSNSEVTPVDEEIQRLYDETGESGIVPDRPQRYITVDGERIDLSAEQYTQYAEERGQMQFSMLEGLVDSSAYQRLSDTDKAAIVSDVYSYADAVTKSHVSDYEPDGWIAKVVESGADPAEYILYKHSLTDGMTLKDRSAALERSGITGREKTDLLLAENPEWTEKAREYGVSDRVYVEFKVATSDVSADKDEDGKPVSGSKKKKVMDIIDGMDVSDEVKDSLYYAAGYTESTIDDAPWR